MTVGEPLRTRHVEGRSRVEADGGAIGRRRRAAQITGGEDYHHKRREVIRAATAIFQRKGYRSTTLTDIAADLNTDRPTLYYYVSGKEELLHEAINEYVLSFVSEAREIGKGDQPAPAKLRAFMALLMSSFDDHYPHPYLFLQETQAWRAHPGADTFIDAVHEIQAQAAGIIDQGIRDGDFRCDLPGELIANAMLGMLNWTHRWYRPEGRYPADQVSSSFAAMLLDGLTTAPRDDRCCPTE